MRVSVPLAGQGIHGDPYRPRVILHGQMHLDIPAAVVVYTDDSFTEKELAMEGVQALDVLPSPLDVSAPRASPTLPAPYVDASWKKGELLAYARSNGVDVQNFWTKERILKAILGSE